MTQNIIQKGQDFLPKRTYKIEEETPKLQLFIKEMEIAKFNFVFVTHPKDVCLFVFPHFISKNVLYKIGYKSNNEN